jgi:HD superfamily phosphohydrolase
MAKKHEKFTELLIRDGEVSEALKSLGSGFASDVADVIKKAGQASIYGAVVSSQFDADRLDYMQRDRLMTGTHHGVIDFDWLLSNLKVCKFPEAVDGELVREIETFALGPKALHAAEAYLLGLFQLYATVYFHKATRGAEKLFTELLARVFTLALAGSFGKTGLSENHPLIRFAKAPDDLACTLALDDSVIGGALSMMTEADDSLISDFSRRLHDRKLFKCIDVRERLNQAIGSTGVKSSEVCSLCTKAAKQVVAVRDEYQRRIVLDRACDAAEERLQVFAKENNREMPKVLLDKTERSMYNPLEESKGPLNQIMIQSGDENSEPVDVASISQVIKAIAPFKVFRVYMETSDQKAKRFVEQIIKEEATKCRS